jgi:hypothetical protein
MLTRRLCRARASGGEIARSYIEVVPVVVQNVAKHGEQLMKLPVISLAREFFTDSPYNFRAVHNHLS